MFGLPLIDIVVIIAYFLVMIGIGLWSMRRIKNQEDYFLGGRRFGKVIQTFAAFGQSTSADHCVGTVTTTFTNGASGIWSALIYLPATPLYWMVSPWMRRLRLLTLGDFYEERYGSRRMAATYAILGSIMMMAYLSIGFSAMSKTILAITPKTADQFTHEEIREYNLADELSKLRQEDYLSLDDARKARLKELQLLKPRKVFSHLNKDALIWIVCLIVLIYTVAGGLTAAFISDTIQGIFILFLTFILLPIGWAKINTIYGGEGFFNAFRTIHNTLPESDFEIFGSPSAIDFTWYYIISIAILGTLNSTVQPNMLVATGSARDEYTARFGFVLGTFMKRFCTVFWGIFALSAIVLYSESVHDPDLVWGYATLDLLGPLKLGLVGLMIASLTAALMSTADCLMITSSSLLTKNIYRLISPERSEGHYVRVGRFMGAVVVIGGALIATRFDTILQLMKFIWEFNTMLAASFWLGMKWRRVNRIAAWSSILSAMFAFFILPISLPLVIPGLKTNPNLLKMTNPEPMVRTYTVREMDIVKREKEILVWDRLEASEKIGASRPVPLKLGQVFEKTFVLEQKAVFWSQGIKKSENGQIVGNGSLNLELLVFDKLGCDLTKNPYALNETIRILIKIIMPFTILVIVALLTRPDDKKRLDRFYVKMKTPVLADRDADTKELAESYSHPDRFDHMKLFPGSQWEFDKWNTTDIVGFTVSVGVVFAIIGLLFALVSIGK
ncbi:sodium:solute symporter [Candidatus Latescibacterota bacterium]